MSHAVVIGFAHPTIATCMLLTTFLFFAAAGLIYFSCEYFVNGIEWFGRKMNLGSTATGTVLAAFGTALPESAVTFTAVVFGSDKQKDIGVGAAIGGPLVLATVAYGIVGIALWYRRFKKGRKDMVVRVDNTRLAKDQLSFLVIFALKVGLGLVAFSFKPWLGLVFLLAYAVYVWREVIGDDMPTEEPCPEALLFAPKSNDPPLFMVSLQLVFALAVIAFASHLFVAQLSTIGLFFGIPPHIVALLLSPVATELPETMNALIWIRQGKERLALANISGAMMIQATIPSALGIYFTPWLFDRTLLVAAGITALAILFLWNLFRRGPVDSRILGVVIAFYGVFAAYLAIAH